MQKWIWGRFAYAEKIQAYLDGMAKTQSLRAKAILKKGYVLYVNEGIGENYRRYSYHLQKDDKMICRWDNAPHWRGIRTFPFHLHVPDKDKPIECGEVFVSDVLLEIKDIFRINDRSNQSHSKGVEE